MHAFDLEPGLPLIGALGEIALGHLAVASGDLLDPLEWVATVVCVDIVKVWLIGVMAASVEAVLHTFGIGNEVLLPPVVPLGRRKAKPLVEILNRELFQAH